MTILPIESLLNKCNLLLQDLDGLLTQQSTSWPHILSSVNVILSKYNSLTTELVNYQDQLQSTLLPPFTLIQNDPEFMPRVLLRSRLIPNMTDEEIQVLKTQEDLSHYSTEDLQNKLSRLRDMMTNISEIVSDLKDEMNSVLKLQKSQDKFVSSTSSRFELENTLQWMSQGIE